ncbi:voltage-gated chloride channel family protein [Rubrolithibacter danxiaensis]|uniref:voltage-gated chloride channel family protein n=1 Tax=Rubrolithibacter danxiaensis TaxID=3390805 RepID=UPI003BF893BC
MTDRSKISSEHISILKYLTRWTYLVVPAAVVIGSMIALFLWLLHQAIYYRFQHTWLLYLLPLAGIGIHFIYKAIGKSSEKGNNLIVEEIHEPGAGIPKRMGPIVLFTTVITHLFGGSAGREGTAVQIGGSIAGMFGSWYKLNQSDTRLILTAGVAAGFGAVFGTPLTGAIFAMEVLTIGQIKYQALFPCLIASIIGDLTVSAWGIHHTAYHIDVLPLTSHLFSPYFSLDIFLLVKIIFASIAFGLASYLFAELAHLLKNLFLNLFKKKWLIPVCGGLLIIGLTFLLGKPDYLSLGIDAEYPGAVTIPSAFQAGGAHTWSWFWKTIYTTITLSTGFKGGEVTPLFYIGATLGNTLSGLLNAPVSLFAALGFIAVFAGATNTPLACTIMGIELFGGEHALFFAVSCFTAYLFSGHSGIYSSHKIAVPKILNAYFSGEGSLAEAGSRRRRIFRKKLMKFKLLFGSKKSNNR